METLMIIQVRNNSRRNGSRQLKQSDSEYNLKVSQLAFLEDQIKRVRKKVKSNSQSLFLVLVIPARRASLERNKKKFINMLSLRCILYIQEEMSRSSSINVSGVQRGGPFSAATWSFKLRCWSVPKDERFNS